jgi:ATP-dependent DNA helicase RecQ
MHETLRKYFGYTNFHPLQEEIISDVLNNHDVLVLMPTGGGKSLCYQLPALMKDGLTVVISPLISLMKDQVDDLHSIGIPAVSINSTLDYNKVAEIKSQLMEKQIKLLYVTPERIMIPDFLDFLQELNLSLLAIDEAHCISEWGHDFRPEYRKLNLLKIHFPTIPLIALTSTAIVQVQNDIVNQLNMVSPKIYRASLNRKNLFYQIWPKKETYKHLLQYLKNHQNNSGIIYCQSRKSVDTLSLKLQKEGIRALPYHAGLSSNVRTENQGKFINDDVEIIVATIAFGMGIDKPNVRYVIHCDMPKSVEGYYQETGRAGRDGLKSDCILFFSYADKIKHEYFIKQIENQQYRQIAYKKLWDILNFCTSKKCRRKYLLNYFDEKYDVPNCTLCDVCMPPEKVDAVLFPKSELKVSKAKNSFDFKYSESDKILFEILRKLRKEIADKERMPPYIVFSDVSLKEMSTRHPQSLEAFREIIGVGEVKLKKYGSLFLEKIIDYCKANNIKSGADIITNKSYSVVDIQKKFPTAYEKWTNEEEQKLISGYNNGKTIEELSKLLGRQIGGIRSRLKKLKLII